MLSEPIGLPKNTGIASVSRFIPLSGPTVEPIIVTMAAAWHGGVPETGGDKYVGDASLLAAISRAMSYWFTNDFTVHDCLELGGTGSCPCGTPGLWNSNVSFSISHDLDFSDSVSPVVLQCESPCYASLLLLTLHSAYPNPKIRRRSLSVDEQHSHR